MEAWGLPHARPAYDARDTLAWLNQKYRSCRHYQPALYQGHHHQKAKLTVWPCGKKTRRRRPHAPAHRALSQVAAIRTDNCLPGWRRRSRGLNKSPTAHLLTFATSWTHRDWTDATDLCRLYDMMMMMIIINIRQLWILVDENFLL